MTRARLSTTAIIVSCITLSTSITASALTLDYKVSRGDTLWNIAARHGTSVHEIALLNNLNRNAVLPMGKVIKVPVSSTAPNRSGSVSRAERSLVHVNATAAILRSGPSTSNGRVASLPNGATGRILLEKGSWTKIALGDGTCGYIYSPLLLNGPGSVNYSASNPVPGAVRSTDGASGSSNLIRTALACRGVRYSRGGTSRSGFDCSGFTRYVFAKYGVSLPHSSAAQSRLGKPVARGDLKPGDLVFFATYRRGVSHVGIYVGNNNFIHAPRSGRTVCVESLGTSYYSSRYRGARRVR